MKQLIALVVGATIYSQAWALDPQTQCLARNIYWEARGETLEGQLAVAATTLNRVKHPEFPRTICGVVYQPGQFSWTATHRKAKISDWQGWQQAVLAAQLAQDYYPHSAFPALYFYNPKKIRPLWARRKQVVARIGSHVFLR